MMLSLSAHVALSHFQRRTGDSNETPSCLYPGESGKTSTLEPLVMSSVQMFVRSPRVPARMRFASLLRKTEVLVEITSSVACSTSLLSRAQKRNGRIRAQLPVEDVCESNAL